MAKKSIRTKPKKRNASHIRSVMFGFKAIDGLKKRKTEEEWHHFEITRIHQTQSIGKGITLCG